MVSLTDGAKVASITDGLLDAPQFKVVGFVLEGKPGKGFLPLASIRGFGDDAFTIETTDTIKWSTGHLPVEGGTRAHDVIGPKVVDATGTDVGAVSDVTFEPADGAITSFEVRSGGLFGLGADVHLVEPSSVKGIGSSLMTVESLAPVTQPT